jgi:hypothetical protein
MSPRVKVIAGVVVSVATEPDTPFAVTTETEVTVPEPAPNSMFAKEFGPVFVMA